MLYLVLKSTVLVLLFKLTLSQSGIKLAKNICIDDENWVVASDGTLGYTLDCSYYGTSTIIVQQSLLHFASKINTGNWAASNYERYDCQSDLSRYSAYRLNYTYTIQQECTSTLYKVTAGYNQGVRCLLRKEFLKSNLFKLNREVLQYETYAFPIPYGLAITYSCV